MITPFQRERNKYLRTIKKEIEKKLHPIPTINNFIIAHRHASKAIIFTAWSGDIKINNRELRYDRIDILQTPNFYKTEDSLFKWLATKEIS